MPALPGKLIIFLKNVRKTPSGKNDPRYCQKAAQIADNTRLERCGSANCGYKGRIPQFFSFQAKTRLSLSHERIIMEFIVFTSGLKTPFERKRKQLAHMQAETVLSACPIIRHRPENQGKKDKLRL